MTMQIDKYGFPQTSGLFETIKTIDQVLNKLQTESFSELNYFKLKQLNEGL